MTRPYSTAPIVFFLMTAAAAPKPESSQGPHRVYKFYSNISDASQARHVSDYVKSQHLAESIRIDTDHPRNRVEVQVTQEQSVGLLIQELKQRGIHLKGRKKSRNKQSWWKRLFTLKKRK